MGDACRPERRAIDWGTEPALPELVEFPDARDSCQAHKCGGPKQAGRDQPASSIGSTELTTSLSRWPLVISGRRVPRLSRECPERSFCPGDSNQAIGQTRWFRWTAVADGFTCEVRGCWRKRRTYVARRPTGCRGSKAWSFCAMTNGKWRARRDSNPFGERKSTEHSGTQMGANLCS